MKNITIVTILLIGHSILYSQNQTPFSLTLKEDENQRMDLILNTQNSCYSISEFPGGSVLIDYLVNSQDSASVIIQLNDIYFFTKIKKINGTWTSVRTESWGQNSINKYNRKEESQIKYKLLDFQTVLEVKNGIETPLKFLNRRN